MSPFGETRNPSESTTRLSRLKAILPSTGAVQTTQVPTARTRNASPVLGLSVIGRTYPRAGPVRNRIKVVGPPARGVGASPAGIPCGSVFHQMIGMWVLRRAYRLLTADDPRPLPERLGREARRILLGAALTLGLLILGVILLIAFLVSRGT